MNSWKTKREQACGQHEDEPDLEYEMEAESGSDGESVSSANRPNGRASSEKTSREPSTAVKDATASNWRYGKWLMGKSLGEL